MASTEMRELIKRLERALAELGFSKKEVAVYLELARAGKASPQDIVERTGFSSAFVYRTLKKLMDHGLVLRIGDRPQLYEIIDPRKVLSVLLRKKAEEIEELADAIPSLESLLEKEEMVGENTGIRIYRATNDAKNIVELLREAKEHVLLSLETRYLSRIWGSLRNTVSRGLVVDVVQYGEEPLPPLNTRSGFWEIRRRPVPSLNLAIADRDFGIVFNPRYRYALVLEDPLLVDTLSMTFYHILWKPSQRVSVGQLPRWSTIVVRYLFRATEIIRMAPKEREIEVVVEGYGRDGRFVRVRGRPVGVFSNSHDVIYYLVIEDEDGRRIAVGDRGAIKEDVAAEKIFLTFH